MATKTRLVGAGGEGLAGGIQVEGLAETIRALQKVDKSLRAEAVDIFRDEAKAVQSRAKGYAKQAPSAASSVSWIGRSATGKGAGVKLNAGKNPRAYATEFGMHKWHQRTWGGSVRGWVQSALRRRTFKPYKGFAFDVTGGSGPGFVIQQALRDLLPGMEERVANRLTKVMAKALDQAGVPRG